MQYSPHTETLHLAVSLYTRFLERQYVHSVLQCRLLAVTVALLAVKFLDDVDVYYSRTLKHVGFTTSSMRRLLVRAQSNMLRRRWSAGSCGLSIGTSTCRLPSPSDMPS